MCVAGGQKVSRVACCLGTWAKVCLGRGMRAPVGSTVRLPGEGGGRHT